MTFPTPNRSLPQDHNGKEYGRTDLVQIKMVPNQVSTKIGRANEGINHEETHKVTEYRRTSE